MVFTRKFYFALFSLLLAPVIYAWPSAPSTNWDFNYDASCGLRPDQCGIAVEKIAICGYQTDDKEKPAFAGIIISQNNQTVLKLNNDGDEGSNKYANYRLLMPSENKARISQTTLDAKFRLTNSSENSAQFTLSMAIQGDESSPDLLMGHITFSNNGVIYFNDNRQQMVNYKIGNNWHIARIHLDFRHKKFTLFLDDRPAPVFLAKMSILKNNKPQLLFGDGSQNVKGSVEVEYVRFVNSELIPVK